MNVPITAANTVAPIAYAAAAAAPALQSLTPQPYQHTIVVAAGQTRTGVDFGNRLANRAPTVASLSDSPDPVPAGGTVTLAAGGVTDPDGAVSHVAFYRETNRRAGLQTGAGGDTLLGTDGTAADGFRLSVSVAGLAGGVYTYHAQASDGAGATSAARATTNTVKPGGKIAGAVFTDVNGNGLRDAGDAGLAGWRVYLDADRDGRLDAGERNTLSDSAGRYAFAGLPAGTHYVRYMVQGGWVRVAPSGGWHAATLTNTASGVSSAYGKNFAVARLAAISGRVFDDANTSGAQDAGEAGLANFRVYADRNNNGALDAGERSVLSDASGNYVLRDLAPGAYVVRQVAQSGWRLTAPAAGYYLVTLTSGKGIAGKTFGDVRASQVSGIAGVVSGKVFADADRDGRRDPGESALSRWRVYLDADRDGVFDRGEASVLTDAAGAFSFDKVPAGAHTLRVVRPSGWSITLPGGAAAGGAHVFTITAARMRHWREFGARRG
jgi:hypothetical protein